MKNKRHRRIDLTVYMKGKESPRKKGNKKKNEQRRIYVNRRTKNPKERINQGHFLTLAHHSWFGETVLVPRRFFLFSSAGVAHLCLFVWFQGQEVVTAILRRRTTHRFFSNWQNRNIAALCT